MILAVTIMHSGTHALFNLLGAPPRRMTALRNRHSDNLPIDILFAHLMDEQMESILATAKEMPVITTARPYDDIRNSWICRGESLSEFEKQRKNFELLLAECHPYVLYLGKRFHVKDFGMPI